MDSVVSNFQRFGSCEYGPSRAEPTVEHGRISAESFGANMAAFRLKFGTGEARATANRKSRGLSRRRPMTWRARETLRAGSIVGSGAPLPRRRYVTPCVGWNAARTSTGGRSPRAGALTRRRQNFIQRAARQRRMDDPPAGPGRSTGRGGPARGGSRRTRCRTDWQVVAVGEFVTPGRPRKEPGGIRSGPAYRLVPGAL